jgi:mRNA interferase RelE/StbE
MWRCVPRLRLRYAPGAEQQSARIVTTIRKDCDQPRMHGRAGASGADQPRMDLDKQTTMSYSQTVVYFDADIKKGLLPRNVAALFRSAFAVVDSTKDLNLFDIKQFTSSTETVFYRLRKGKYRAIFIMKEDDVYVLDIAKRDEVYKRWP